MSRPHLCTADHLPIACWGVHKVHLAAGGRRFTWDFLLADVALPNIGADFLRNFGLLVDLQMLARRGGWSQHLVEPSGGDMFATIGVVADQPPQARAAHLHQHIGAAHSSSLPSVEAPPSAPSLPTVEAPSGSPFLQCVLGKFPRSPSWTCEKVSIRFLSRRMACKRPQSSLLLGCGSLSACHLGCATQARRSSASWTKCWGAAGVLKPLIDALRGAGGKAAKIQ